MKSVIVVLFDSASIRHESLQYSVELAKRMNSGLILLVILSVEGEENAVEGIEPILKRGVLAREKLVAYVKTVRSKDVSVEIVVRMGNPRSELVKYLAETGRVKTIVWGGSPEQMNKKDHWLVLMKDILDCPVVTPFKKSFQNKRSPEVAAK